MYKFMYKLAALAALVLFSFGMQPASAGVITFEDGGDYTLQSAEEVGEDIFYTGLFNTEEDGSTARVTLRDPNDAFADSGGLINFSIGVIPLSSNLTGWQTKTYVILNGEEFFLEAGPIRDTISSPALEYSYLLDFSEYKNLVLEVTIGDGRERPVNGLAFYTMNAFDLYSGSSDGGGSDPVVMSTPASFGFLGLGLLALGVVMRRRHV
jgi:hypothetical protein